MRFLLTLFSALAANAAIGYAGTNQIAIIHVGLIDATGATLKPGRTVLLEGNSIAAVGKDERVKIPEGARIIDGGGKYLIPGLWDMHVHLNKEFLPLFIANGVTGVRIMWGFTENHEWRKEIEQGRLLGPRMLIASTIVDGPKPSWPGSVAAGTPEQGRAAVLQAKKDNADFVKVYTGLPRDVFFAIADECKKQGLSFAGHVPLSVSVQEASDAGQKSMEHMLGLLRACSSEEAALAKTARELLEQMPAGPERTNFLGRLRQLTSTALATYSPSQARTVFKKLKRNDTWQCPTFTVLHNLMNLRDPALTNDARLRYLSPEVKGDWAPEKIPSFLSSTPEDIALQKRTFQELLDIVDGMQRAGVPILAGTDTPNPYCLPGFSLHDELAWLVRAGLTPMQALQCATRNPARYLGCQKELGTIEPGKLADLVLLDANPLEDIRHTKDIAAVVVNGRLLDRNVLDQLLAEAEARGVKH